jgi:hypothetical protein
MNNTPLADIVEKVKKCLRLAERGTEHEKKVAMEKAASIAQNYRIDMTLLNLEDESTPIRMLLVRMSILVRRSMFDSSTSLVS